MKQKKPTQLTESQIEQILREQNIDEGLWDSIKHGLAKITSLRKSLPFGSDRRAAADRQYQAIVDKADNEFSKQINTLSKQLKAKGFPNQKSRDDFLGDAHTLAAIYDTVVQAAKDCKIPKEVANEIINDLRKMFEFFIDHELESVYKRLAEAEDPEDFVFEPGEVDREPEGPLTGTSDTKAKKELYSTTAPKVLAALGALGTGFGWLVRQPWFIALFKSPKTITTVIKTIITLHEKGVTEHLAVLMGQPGANLSGMTVGAMKAALKANGLVDASGQPTNNLIQLASNGGNTKFLSWWNAHLAGTMHDSETLAQAIPLNGPGAVGAGGDIFTKTVSKSIKQTIGGGTISATTATVLGAAGPILTGLGVGLLASGAAVYFLRKHGQKHSRLKTLQGILEEMVPVEDVNCNDTGTGTSSGGGTSSGRGTSSDDTADSTATGSEDGGKGETIHIFQKGPHKFIGRGKKDISLLTRLQQAGLPNWAIKDLTDRIKKELEDKGFVVKEAKKKKKTKNQRRKLADRAKRQAQHRAKEAARKAQKAATATNTPPTTPPTTDTTGASTPPTTPPGRAGVEIKGNLQRMVIEFGQDTTTSGVSDDGELKPGTRKWKREEITKNPAAFIKSLSKEEKALLLRLPEDPNKEPSKFDFFKMSPDERKKLYLQIKQGKADYTRDFQIQPKPNEFEKTKFFISNLRDILKTGHTSHNERPIQPDVIRGAMEQISDYLSDYLEDAGIALRESMEIDRWAVLVSGKRIIRG